MKHYFISMLYAPDITATGGNITPEEQAAIDAKSSGSSDKPVITAPAATSAPVQIDLSKPLILRRLSSMPNKNNSYAYAVVSGFPEGCAGSYATANGLVMYSPARLGDLGKDVTVNKRLATANGKTYCNLVDPAAEQYGALFSAFNIGKRMGINEISLGNNAASLLFQMAGLSLPQSAAAAPQPQP